MATYFHIPPEGGWEEFSYYVVELSKQKSNPVFSGLLRVGLLDSNNHPSNNAVVYINADVIKMEDFQYVKAIRKIDMSTPNKGKLINKLNIFELKQHMKEVQNGIEFPPVY